MLRRQLISYELVCARWLLIRLLVQGAHTPGADVESLEFTINHNLGRVDIRVPTSEGMTFRMADIITELAGFPA